MKQVQTVLGPIDSARLGHCQAHEHVWVHATPASVRIPQLRIDRMEASLAELRTYRAAGGMAIVDAQPVGAGRDIGRLAALSIASGVHIVAATGFHRPMFYPQFHWIHGMSGDELVRLFVSEVRKGAFAVGSEAPPSMAPMSMTPPQMAPPSLRTPHRAGLVKAALGQEPIGQAPQDDWTIRLLEAAGTAAVEAGTALMLHTEAGSGALEAIRRLERLGLPASRVIVCHADRQASDPAPVLAIAETGARLDFDTIGRFKYHDDDSEIALIRTLCDAGHARRLMLALDTTAERLTAYGGPLGLDYLITTFLPALERAGLDPALCARMVRENPAEALTMEA